MIKELVEIGSNIKRVKMITFIIPRKNAYYYVYI